MDYINNTNDMDTQVFFDRALRMFGKITQVTYTKTCKVKKAYKGDVVTKTSNFQVRVGIEYNNQKAVKEKHENGEVEKRGLPDGWEKKSKVWYVSPRGKNLLGCSPLDTNKRSTQWYLNGKPVDYSDVESMIYASDKPKKDKEKPDWMYLNVLDIDEIKLVK